VGRLGAYHTTMADLSTSSQQSPAAGGAVLPSAPGKAAHSDAHIKDTVESILVAFILAFIFRGFIVEAFVIPTGSMAPTLYGAHMRLTCPDCGYTWDVGYKTGGSDDTDIRSSDSRNIRYHCPNCGYAIAESPRIEESDLRQADQPVRFGDRILVLKYLYLFTGPTRWDVVVFKSPSPDSRKDETDPDYSMNFIKRLVGLPGESLVILDGSIFTAAGNANLEFAADGRTVLGADQFTIRRRPDYAQDRLWRVIDNNDYLPHLDRSQDPDQTPWRQPWTAGTTGSAAWQVTDDAGRPSRTFRLNNPDGADTLRFDADANPDTHAMSDWLGYDEAEHSDSGGRWRPVSVGDLKLDCFYTRVSGDGALRMQLTKRDDVFTARITRGKVALLHGKIRQADPLLISDESIVGSELALPELAGGAPVHLELENVDYRVTVRVNGKAVLQTSDADYHPDVARLFTDYDNERSSPRPQVRIIGEKQSCTLEHISLSRDIYYLNHGDRNFWGSPDKIVHLGNGEYFVMGDNSFISGDARYWDKPVMLPSEGLPYVESGRVPAEFMLGKAFFVYWPAGYQPAKPVPVNLVPDFGEMRFIH
jgi:signal peptidase I